MLNRFNFNAIIASYYDTPDDTCEIHIYIEGVDVYDGGSAIGVNRGDVLDAIKKQHRNLNQDHIDQIMQFFEDNSSSSDNEVYFILEPDTIFPCTGYKDSDLNLIFEGDYIEQGRCKYLVQYKQDKFVLKNVDTLQCCDINILNKKEFRKTGNICFDL